MKKTKSLLENSEMLTQQLREQEEELRQQTWKKCWQPRKR